VIFQKAFLSQHPPPWPAQRAGTDRVFKGEVFLRDRALRFLFEDADLRPSCSGAASCTLVGDQAATAACVERSIFADR